ncbi:TIGR02452 family protein [Plebeiibacterium sediminum]|uniref:TIGR02452 family protein n=1 Tax=Plebeiibacterium sediminum TaxID=2992112 RepID=A0AAE3M6Y9_9BACT|nr:TIGR02452 family protein [Plebeiobacterium sediminum]MCW3787929.1 TIGR02452 family protein [Plebeiobacterium sediminum]
MNNREIRKQIAEDTLDILKKGFFYTSNGNQINISDLQEKAENLTKVYTPEETDRLIENLSVENIKGETEIKVKNQPTLEAVRELIAEGNKDVVCLNFASAKNPGGGFLGGSQAQEESIARATGLYNCQIKTNGYYETNRNTKTCLYTDYMIYSPFVPIIKDEEGKNLNNKEYCAIITAPAVNKGVVKNKESEKLSEVENVMKRRINKVLAISLENNHRTIVLGAWGCGVFQNEPKEIAKYFGEIIKNNFANKFNKIVFAIYSKNEKFIEPFVKEFD